MTNLDKSDDAIIRERQRILDLIFKVRDKPGRSLDWCNALNEVSYYIDIPKSENPNREDKKLFAEFQLLMSFLAGVFFGILLSIATYYSSVR